jgi:nicotinamidase-related amidase
MPMSATGDNIDSLYERAGFGARVERGRSPAVVVVDLSRGFTDPRCPLGSELSSEVAATRQLLDAARAADAPIFFTTIAFEEGEQSAWLSKAPGLAVLAAGSQLIEIDPRLEPRDGEPIIFKKGASAFFGTDLAERLHELGVDTVVICGATTSGCVRASVVDSVQHDFPTLVVREAVGDRAQPPGDAALFDIEQKYGDVISVDDAVAYLSARLAYEEGTR